jgi:hypothetical protein
MNEDKELQLRNELYKVLADVVVRSKNWNVSEVRLKILDKVDALVKKINEIQS